MVQRAPWQGRAFCAASAAALLSLGCSSHTDVVATTTQDSADSDRVLGQTDVSLCTAGLYKGVVTNEQDAGVRVFDTATISFSIVAGRNGTSEITTMTEEAGLTGTTANGDKFSAALTTDQVCNSGSLPNAAPTITVIMSDGAFTIGQTQTQIAFGGTIQGSYEKPDGRPRFEGTWKALAHLGTSSDLPFSGTWWAELLTYGDGTDGGT